MDRRSQDCQRADEEHQSMIGSRHHTIPFQQSRPRMSYVGSKDSRPVSVAPGVVGSHIDRGRDIGNGGRAPEASHRDGQRGNKRGWDSYSDRERDFDRNASRDLRRPVGHAGFERGRDDMRGLDKQRFEERSQRRIDEKKTVYSERHADLRMGRYRSGSDSAATSWSSASNGREAVPIVNISRSMDRNSRSTTAQGGRSHGRKGEERELGELPSVTKTGEKQVSNSQEIQSDKESGELSRSTKEGVLQAQDSEEMEPGELPSESTTESITWSANTSIPGGSNHESELDDRGRRSSPHKKPKFTPVVWDYVAQQVQPNKFSDGLVSGPVIGLMSNAIQDSSVSAHNLPLSIPTLLSSPSQISSITPLPSIHEFPAAVDRGISSTSSGSPSSVTSFSIAELGMSPKTVGLNHKSELGGTDRKDNMSRSAGEDADFEAGQCSPEVGERGEETLSPAPITIANSRWAEIDETPEQIESPIQAGGLRSSLGSDNNITALTENGKGGNRNLRNHSESNKILREKFTITHAKGKGNKSDDLGKDLPSKLLADQEYEQELNKRELMELYEEESDGEDEEEPRPYEDSEPEDFVDGSSEHARKFDMLQGCRSVNEFQLLNKIDEGTYGVVYRARNKQTGEIVALKRVKMEGEREGFPLTALREINVLLSLHHPSVVDVKEIVVGSTIDRIYTVMEYMEHELKGLMESLKQPFSTSEVKCLMLQLFEGVQYLHDNWVLHRDLKTSNLLMNNAGELKICDFGLARQYGSPLQIYSHMVVTLWYRAPELLLGSKQYSTAIDMWSLGCIMAELLAKQPLLTGKSEIDQIDKIFKMLGTPNEKIWPEYSKLPGVQCNFVKQPYNRLKEKFPVAAFGGGPSLSESGFDLLNRLLTYDPRKRITADEALKHAWFREDPLPKAKELMPTYPARSEHARRRRRLVKSPDPLQKEHKKEMGRGEPEGRGLFG